MLAPSGLTYDRFKDQGLLKGDINYFNYQAKGFKTPSKKVELYSAQLSKWGFDPLPAFPDPVPPSLEYPLLATSRKSPYFFHSAYRQIDSLRKKHPDPVVEIHPQAARILGLREGEWAAIVTPQGQDHPEGSADRSHRSPGGLCRLRLVVSRGRPGTAF